MSFGKKVKLFGGYTPAASGTLQIRLWVDGVQTGIQRMSRNLTSDNTSAISSSERVGPAHLGQTVVLHGVHYSVPKFATLGGKTASDGN